VEYGESWMSNSKTAGASGCSVRRENQDGLGFTREVQLQILNKDVPKVNTPLRAHTATQRHTQTQSATQSEG